MERKEAYEQIKKLGLQGICQKKYGKNFTQCKTNELEAVIKAAKVGVGAEVKATKATNEFAATTEEPKDAFYKLLAILRKRHILLESDIKEILS